jgi:predicted ATPase with chaperone activity
MRAHVKSIGHRDLAAHAVLPAAPRTVEETGLSLLFLVELVAKTLFRRGSLRLAEIAESVKLTRGVLESVMAFMRQEKLCEVFARSTAETDLSFVLSDLGRRRAEESIAKNQYSGPAPVPLQAYINQCALQQTSATLVHREDMQRTFDGIVMDPWVLDQLGAALNSGRAMFLFGPAGAGKTFIAERLIGAIGGQILVPHAIEIDGEIVTVFDPLVHHPLVLEGGRTLKLEQPPGDQRWVLCCRPFVLAGGELTLSMLDLQFDPATRYYSAPPQLKANGGMLIIDDLGRQQVPAQSIMNRWIVPLDRRVDYLTLHTGLRIKVPFDAAVVFSSNFKPAELSDEALIRRLGYKIFIGPLTERQYRQVFLQTCAQLGVAVSDAVVSDVLARHGVEGRPLLAYVPRELAGAARDVARYRGTSAVLHGDLLEWAWANCFGAREHGSTETRTQ